MFRVNNNLHYINLILNLFQKIAYNEQMTKLNKDQEKIVQEKLQKQMEIMCQRQREELDRYNAHITGLTSQLWSVGEKLLIEQQQKQDTLQRLKELEIKVKEFQVKELHVDQPMATISRKTCRYVQLCVFCS